MFGIYCDEAQGRREAVEEGNMLNNECENLIQCHIHARTRFSWSRVILNFPRPSELQFYRNRAIDWEPGNQQQNIIDVGNASS